jgi:hypothetical protein
MLTWDEPNERYYEHGLDRGVIYPNKIPAGPIDMTNDAVNPRGLGQPWLRETGAGGVATIQTYTSGGPFDLPYVEVTWTTAPTGSNAGISVRPLEIPVTAGETISFGIYGKRGNDLSSRMAYVFVDATGTTLGIADFVTNTNPGAGVWNRYVKENLIVPPTAVNMRAYFRSSSAASVPVGGTIAAAAFMLVRGPVLPDYFDGSSKDADNIYEWVGDVDDSASVRRPLQGSVAIPWNGLTGVEEGSSGESSLLYRDGVVYLADSDASDFTASMSALFFPDEFGECIGIPEVADGFFVDDQKPKRFSLSYRSLIGSGTEGDMFGYQIHLVYNIMASIGTRSRKSMGSEIEPIQFAFDLVCTPVKLPGYRPTAHYIIDTRNMSLSTISAIEDILYGTSTQAPRFPTPTELFDLMNYGVAIIVTDHGDGTFSIEGSNDNVVETDSNHFQVHNINSTTPDVNGEYTISDGGATTVVVG